MSGTVLSTLCSICHAAPPKYKCPRCTARTCSVPCVQKHKARADCDGVRNPRAFIPLTTLKTESGIDHDFNFLSSIERARQRAEKDILEARQLLSEKDLRPRNEGKQFQKVWYGEELHHVPVQQPQPFKNHGGPQGGPAFIDGFDKHVRRRLRYLDINVITMPRGMARQKENKTAFNRRTSTINWQVEWLVYNASQLGLPVQQDQQPLRVSYKSLEGIPLDTSLATTLDWYRGRLDRQSRKQQQDPTETDAEADPAADEPPRKKRKTHNKKSRPLPYPSPTQDPSTGTWPSAPYTAQHPLTSVWSQTITTPAFETTLEEQLGTWQFYLVKVNAENHNQDTTISKKNKFLIPLASTETLATALTGRTVIEFPTLLAIPRGMDVPAGYAVGPAERREPRTARVEVEDKPGSGRSTPVGHERYNGNVNTRKRGFADANNTNHWAGGREYGQRRGRGGKWARFDGRRPPAREAAVREEPRSEAEEGEVNSDAEEGEINSGDEDIVMDGLADGEPNGSARYMYINGELDDGNSSATVGHDDQGIARHSGGLGGLVDYGSSDESD